MKTKNLKNTSLKKDETKKAITLPANSVIFRLARDVVSKLFQDGTFVLGEDWLFQLEYTDILQYVIVLAGITDVSLPVALTALHWAYTEYLSDMPIIIPENKLQTIVKESVRSVLRTSHIE